MMTSTDAGRDYGIAHDRRELQSLAGDVGDADVLHNAGKLVSFNASAAAI